MLKSEEERMSDQERRQGSSRRLSLRKSLSETTLPQEYLDKLEEKRKQLDDSIHKYIASKEREYKVFQKELRQEYKLSQGQDGHNDAVKSSSAENGAQIDQSTQLESEKVSAIDALFLTAERQERDSAKHHGGSEGLPQQKPPSLASLQNGGARSEREQDFLGVFTPGYLTALNAQEGTQAQLSSSAPQELHKLDSESSIGSLERANSDSVVRAKPKRPSHLAFSQRTSSSGSSADGRLASALRSPTQRPKQKRVSLAVGDSIVAPSDSVPTASDSQTTPSHSRKRSPLPERANPIVVKRLLAESEIDDTIAEAALPFTALTDAVDGDLQDRETTSKVVAPTSNPRQASSPPKIDPDGDLFDLADEDEESVPVPIDSEDSDTALESEDESTGRLEPVVLSRTPPVTVGDRRYDPGSGLIPEPRNEETDSAVPYLAFGPNSAIAPAKAGFRRPSVLGDPVYVGSSYKAAEENAVENDVYGSSFNKPTITGSFTSGSLGESYMAQNAEQFAQQRAQIKS